MEERDLPNRSGERRLHQEQSDEAPLPPTPEVLAKPKRFVTGPYSVITPPRKKTA